LHGVYRTKDEVEEQKARDPITHLAAKLKEDGVIDQAALDALDSGGPRRSRGRGEVRRREPGSRSRRALHGRPGRLMATLTYRDALNQALREEMQRDPTSC